MPSELDFSKKVPHPNVYVLDVMNWYSVMQSYANSFWGDVVLDTFNNVSRDEDNILDKIYIKQICPDFYYDDFWFS